MNRVDFLENRKTFKTKMSDVAKGTGIPIERLNGFEAKRSNLIPKEHQILNKYFETKPQGTAKKIIPSGWFKKSAQKSHASAAKLTAIQPPKGDRLRVQLEAIVTVFPDMTVVQFLQLQKSFEA